MVQLTSSKASRCHNISINIDYTAGFYSDFAISTSFEEIVQPHL